MPFNSLSSLLFYLVQYFSSCPHSASSPLLPELPWFCAKSDVLKVRWSRVWILVLPGSRSVTLVSHLPSEDANFLIEGKAGLKEEHNQMHVVGLYIPEVKSLDLTDLPSFSWKYYQSSWSKYLFASKLLLYFWVTRMFSLCIVFVCTACFSRLVFIMTFYHTSVSAILKYNCFFPLSLSNLHNCYTYHTVSNLDQTISNTASKFGENLST